MPKPPLVPPIYSEADLPRLSLLVQESWSALAQGPKLPGLGACIAPWRQYGKQLATAVDALRDLAMPNTAPERRGELRMVPSHLNLAAHRAVAAAFQVLLVRARCQDACGDEWLYHTAPVTPWPEEWTADVDAAAVRLGRPRAAFLAWQEVLPAFREVIALPVPHCLNMLATLATRSHSTLELVAEELGPARLRSLLVATVDEGIVGLSRLQETATPAERRWLPALGPLLHMRATLLAWVADSHSLHPLVEEARRCVDAAGLGGREEAVPW